MRLGSPTRYGWSQQRQKFYGTACGRSWKDVTMLEAIGLGGFRGFMNIESGTSPEVFRAFVEHQLVPSLREGDCVILDNLAAHKNSRTLQRIVDRGATDKFLPPYSPELCKRVTRGTCQTSWRCSPGTKHLTCFERLPTTRLMRRGKRGGQHCCGLVQCVHRWQRSSSSPGELAQLRSLLQRLQNSFDLGGQRPTLF